MATLAGSGTTHQSNVTNVARSVKILGVCWLFYGALRIVGAIWFAFFASTATLMFGALLNRVPHPFSLMAAFHTFYGFAVALDVLTGILGLLVGASIAGASMRPGRTPLRMLALFVAALALPDLPLGIILGVFTIAILLPL